VSLVRGIPVSDKVAMTGEITLTGQVLPIGGVREKTLAAQRAGIKRVVIPHENEPDLEELPKETRQELDFVLADTLDDVLSAAFDGTGAAQPPRPVAADRQAAAPV
jgi:ATP-dependent Lon protease